MTGPRIFTPEYYSRMRDLESGGWWNAGMREAARMLLRLVALPSSGRALDLGCGSGQTVSWLGTLLPAWRFYGLDVAPDGLAAARGRGTDVTRASALAIPHPDDSFDLVVSLDVMQHLPLDGGDRAALEEAHRVLSPGGTLLLRTNAQAFPRTPDDPSASFHKYEPGELRAKLQSAGFHIVRSSRVNAILGLAEIPRELRARAREGARYHGILARHPQPTGWVGRTKRWWLSLEGRAVAAGIRLPLGRTILALCRAR
jgi:SAM-dependent methyltransferase